MVRFDAAHFPRHLKVMYGRYVIALTPETLRRVYGYTENEKPNFLARYNVAPTRPVLVVLQDRAERQFRLMRWGF